VVRGQVAARPVTPSPLPWNPYPQPVMPYPSKPYIHDGPPYRATWASPTNICQGVL